MKLKKWRKDKRKQRNRDWNIFSKTLTGIELDLIEHSEKIREKKKRKKEEEKTRTKKLGRHRFEPLEKQVLLTKELPQSLRQVNTKSNLFLERFKSMQKRNLIPACPNIKPSTVRYRRPKKKTFETYQSRNWEFVY